MLLSKRDNILTDSSTIHTESDPCIFPVKVELNYLKSSIVIGWSPWRHV